MSVMETGERVGSGWGSHDGAQERSLGVTPDMWDALLNQTPGMVSVSSCHTL